MDYLKLKSAKKILERVLANDGQLTWYNIVKDVDQLGLEKIPPTFFVLQELTKQGFLRTEPPEDSNDAKYWLTNAGRNYLNQQHEG